MKGMIGEVRMFGGNFAPRQWAFCNGQLLAISGNSALFSILGTTYGGDGRTTFGLPDLRGRAALGQGTGPGLSPRPLGQRSGTQTETLTSLKIPSHTHPVTNNLKFNVGVASGSANSNEPTDNVLADSGNKQVYAAASSADENMGGVSNTGTVALSPTGGSQAHNNIQPYLAVNYIICLTGLFPSRN